MIVLDSSNRYIKPRRVSENWMQVRDGNPVAFGLMCDHYSFNPKYDEFWEIKTRRFVGPGERIVLLGRVYSAVFVWRKFIDDSGQVGVNCAAFRNAGEGMSSSLILEAELWALDRWGSTRVYTYVNAGMVRSSNPGYCFKKAGWSLCGVTKKQSLLILEKNLSA